MIVALQPLIVVCCPCRHCGLSSLRCGLSSLLSSAVPLCVMPCHQAFKSHPLAYPRSKGLRSKLIVMSSSLFVGCCHCCRGLSSLCCGLLSLLSSAVPSCVMPCRHAFQRCSLACRRSKELRSQLIVASLSLFFGVVIVVVVRHRCVVV